jgi:hypothetical protein
MENWEKKKEAFWVIKIDFCCLHRQSHARKEKGV